MSSLDELYKEKPKGLIYHYTTQKGLLGIIRDKCIWATDIRYLNDTTEYTYASNLCLDLIDKLKKEEKNFVVIDFLNFLQKELYILKQLNVYVCSFSEEKDLLSQWRAYCGQSTNGFCIGFSYTDLKRPLEQLKAKKVRCVYDKKKQEAFINDFLKRAINKFKSFEIVKKPECAAPWLCSQYFLEAKKNRAFKGLLIDFINDYVNIAPILKHHSFKEEKEWRVVLGPFFRYLKENLETFYREGKSLIIPYKKFKLAKADEKPVISEIVIGPTPHKELSMKSLTQFIASEQVESTQCFVKYSNIPYREW